MAKAKKNNDIIEINGITYTLIERMKDKTDVREVPYKLEDIVDEIDNEELCRDPLIQRTDDQWTRKQKSKLIHSILMNRPIGSILTAKGRAESKNYNITSLLDGLQRTTAMVEYVHNGFSLDKKTPPIMCRFKDNDGNIIEHSFDVAGKKFSQLPMPIQNFILTYRITTYSYEGFSDDELDDIVFCVNNGKTPTSYQKLRFLLGSENMRFLQPICDSTLWEDNKNCKAKNDSILCCIIRMLMMMTNYNYSNLGVANMTAFVDEENYDSYVKMSHITELSNLVEQLAEIKFSMTDNEKAMLDACSIPHMVMNLRKFNRMDNPENKSYIDFLREFWQSNEYKMYLGYCDSKGSGSAQYSAENVTARQYVLDDFLDEYLDITDTSETINDNGDVENESESETDTYVEETRTVEDNTADSNLEINIDKSVIDDRPLPTDSRPCGQASSSGQEQEETRNYLSGDESEFESA